MSDVLSSVGGIQQLAATFAGLGSSLANAAPTGQFAAVLSQVNSEISSVENGGTSASAPSAGSSTLSLADAGSLTPGTNAQDGTTASDAVAGTTASDVSGPTGSDVVSDATQYLGVPYQWGGTNPATGLDCSGLVQRVYSDLGISLPRTSQEQANVGTAVPDLASAQPGDLVFFEPSASGPGHVGIYIGNGEMIDAPHTGTDVQIQAVGTPSEIRRVLPTDAAGTSAGTTGVATTSQETAAGPTSSQQAAMTSLGAPASLQPLFEAAGQTYGVDPVLLAAVAKQESGYQPDAVSGAGAQGLMQLMPATAAGLGVSAFDPASAIDGAAQLLSGYLNDYGGSVPMALAAYNAGPGAVASSGGVPPYAETQNYVSDITSMLSSVGDATVAA